MKKTRIKSLILTLLFILISGSEILRSSYNINEVVYSDNIIKPASTNAGYLGVTLGFKHYTRFGGPYERENYPIFNKPMYVPSKNKPEQFWDDIVEQLDYSGIDFVAPTLCGHVAGPVDINAPGDPRLLSGLVDAIYRRGIEKKIKISCLDAIGSSWAAVKNKEKHGNYNREPPFDLADVDGTGEGGYKYIWDQNLRDFFLTIPDELRFKIDGRPVIYNWRVGSYAHINYNDGKSATNVIRHIKESCQDEFGFEPYLIAHYTWVQDTNDPNIEKYIDGVHDWFSVGDGGPDNGWTNREWKGRWYGVCVPEYRKDLEQGVIREIKANHGQKFEQCLQNTVGSGAYVTLVEGFTDWPENAATWRAQDGDYSITHYDYPNQRLNILRKYSRNNLQPNFRLEAEACDFYEDLTNGNDGGAFRDGDLDITEDTSNGITQWYVLNAQMGEWLEWREIALPKSIQINIRYATDTPNGRIRINIGDGTSTISKEIDLPDTGGNSFWKSLRLGDFELGDIQAPTIRLSILGGDLCIDNLFFGVFSVPPLLDGMIPFITILLIAIGAFITIGIIGSRKYASNNKNKSKNKKNKKKEQNRTIDMRYQQQRYPKPRYQQQRYPKPRHQPPRSQHNF